MSLIKVINLNGVPLTLEAENSEKLGGKTPQTFITGADDAKINPNTVTDEIAIIDGSNASRANLPTEAANKFGLLFTKWTKQSETGDTTKSRMQTLMLQNGQTFARYYSTSWSAWLTRNV